MSDDQGLGESQQVPTGQPAPPAAQPVLQPPPPPVGPIHHSRRAITMTVIMSILAVLLLCAVVLTVGFLGTAVSVLAALGPVVVVAALVLLIDRYEPEPRGMLALTFAFGATGAVAIALIFEGIGSGLANNAFGTGGGQFVGTAMIAPFVEEIAKGLAVFVVFLRLKERFNGVVDGIVYGAMVGLGFALAENIMYYSQALLGGQQSFAATFVLRGIFGPFAHPLFTSMTGIGFALSRQHPRARVIAPILGLLAAMALHATWNGGTYLGGAFILVYLGIFVPLVIIAIAIAWVAARREGQVLRTYLATDVPTGLLTAEEVEELTSLSTRRKVIHEAYRQGGATARDARKAFHHAAAQLAFARYSARPNPPDPKVELGWAREIARYKRWVNPGWVPPAGLQETAS